jgi:hypothetical protein
MNVGRNQRSWVVTWATLGSGLRQSLQDSAEKVLNACVDCHPIVQFRVKRNLIFQLGLEVGSISAAEFEAIWWAMKGRATRSVNEYRDVV